MNPKIQKQIKKGCIHEAGHAVVGSKLRIPINFVQMKADWNGNIDGTTDREIRKMKEDLQSKDSSKKRWALVSHLSFFCGGMAAEAICYPNENTLHGCEVDLQRINETLNLIRGLDEGKKEKIFQDALNLAKTNISENRAKLEKLAEWYFRLLMVNNMSFKIEGARVEEILSVERM
jgi:hypothetical protein